MEPLEQAIKARIGASLRANTMLAGATPEKDPQGALLVAAASGVENASTSTQANPFFERLTQVLNEQSSSERGSWSFDIARKMKEYPPSGLPIVPLAVAIGADFAVTRGSAK